MDLGRIERLIADEYRFLIGERAAWSIAAGPQDMELVAHALRVLLHTRTPGDFRPSTLVGCPHG